MGKRLGTDCQGSCVQTGRGTAARTGQDPGSVAGSEGLGAAEASRRLVLADSAFVCSYRVMHRY